MSDLDLNELEGQMRTALRLLADGEAEPPGSDIALARARGRRAVRNRRLTKIAAPVAVAAVTVAAMGLALPRESEKVVPAQGTPNTARTSRWNVPVSFGWLPSGFVPVVDREEDGWYLMTARPSEPGGKDLKLLVYHERPAGRPWEWTTEKDVETSPAEPVLGRPAQWVLMGANGVVLRFQYADGRWAQLGAERAAGESVEDLTGILHEVADRLDVTERPVALPFQVSGLPPEFWLQNAALTEPYDPARRQVKLSFTHGLRVQVFPAGADTGHKPNTTVDGHPAYRFAGTETAFPALLKKREDVPPLWEKLDERRKNLVGTEILCVYGVQRFDVCFYTDAQVPQDPTISIDVVRPGADWASELLKPSGGLIGLFRRMKLIDGPVSGWSADPLRQ